MGVLNNKRSCYYEFLTRFSNEIAERVLKKGLLLMDSWAPLRNCDYVGLLVVGFIRHLERRIVHERLTERVFMSRIAKESVNWIRNPT